MTSAIVSEKSAETYTKIFSRYGVKAERAVMVGNSLRSDIWPALQAGAWTVYIPSEFEWARERADAPEGERRFQRLASFAELPDWLTGR